MAFRIGEGWDIHALVAGLGSLGWAVVERHFRRVLCGWITARGVAGLGARWGGGGATFLGFGLWLDHRS